MSKETGKATIDIPALLPGLNFMAPANYIMYKIVTTLSVIPDITFDKSIDAYSASIRDNECSKQSSETSWFAMQAGSAAMTLGLRIAPPKKGAYSLMLFVGIAFGTFHNAKEEIVKYAGSGKILGMA